MMATWSSAYVNDLPDGAFACVDAAGRHYPHHDASGKVDLPHLRNALSRVAQDGTTTCGRSHLEAHARSEGIGKAMPELKAEALTTSQLDRWLSGKVPRRILVAPFGGPLSKAKGLDLDGEYFDEDTDFYGPYPELRRNRDRLVDFNHATFMDRDHPAEKALKGAIMGRVTLDDHYETVDMEGREFAGLWGDFWANAGEKRRALIAWLEERGHPLYGSTQPIAAGVRRGKAGHIDVWPIQYHTISTTPQNTYAIVPPLKAVLEAPGEVSIDALRAYAVGLDDLGTSLRSPSETGDDGAKAGRVFSRRNEGDLSATLDDLEAALARVRDVLARQTPEPARSESE